MSFQQEQRRIERNRAERDLERAQARRLHTHYRVGEGAWRSRISGVVKPDAPEGPVTYPVTTRRSVTLRWKPPKDNGGADVTAYHIEYQERGSSSWMKVPETTSLLSHTVRGLESAKQYGFRVFAENIVGLSQPLTGDPVATKDPFNPPEAPSTPAVTGYDSNQRPRRKRHDGGRTGRRSTTNVSDPSASAAAASTDPATLEAEVEVQVSVEYYPVSRRSIRSD
ncbi:protein unc-22 [Aphelenchoides avenae]|nr:protein unc-22 [Aphelenchus avenae]